MAIFKKEGHIVTYLAPPTNFLIFFSAFRSKGWCIPAFGFQNLKNPKTKFHHPLVVKAEGKIKEIIGGARYITMCPSFPIMLIYC